MKKCLFFLFFSMWMSVVYAQSNQWAWMSGEKNYTPAEYGIKGVADSANRPGTRYGAASWKDASGNFWLFGGSGSTGASSGDLNDLWKFNPATKLWTWINGDSVPRQKASYGTRGIASSANKPGAFTSAVSWTDRLGIFWMYSNVLWKYTPSINQWTWVNGDTAVTVAIYGIKGMAGAANKPAVQANTVEWTDASGNFLLYGNVLWRYNVATDQWTWVHGDTTNTTTVYGMKGVPNSINTPGTRTGVTAWSDTSGKCWLFGGYGTVSTPYRYGFQIWNNGNLNDLWNYDPATNLWTWVSGDTILYAGGVTGTIGTAAPGNRPFARSNAVSWTDASNNFWLFGGYRYTPFALPSNTPFGDVWKYDPVKNLWTCYKYISYNFSQDTFNVKGEESPYTNPAPRYSAVGWPDSSGSLWLFGGIMVDISGGITAIPLNDLLRYNTKTNLWCLIRENKNGKEYGLYGTKGVADAGNLPGGRYDAVSCTDSAGNAWLFGGTGYGSSGIYPKYLNDLWKRDATGTWTWVSGLTTPVPSARGGAACWTDLNNQLWLFGGQDDPSPFSPFKNDLWKYDKTTSQWTQISASSVGQYGVKGQYNAANKPGGRYNAVSWSDNTGKLWLFGGIGLHYYDSLPDELNDLWNYDPAINQWTWVSGDSTRGQPGVYGKINTTEDAGKPGARQGTVSWKNASGDVWIFGGFTSKTNHLYNDLWKFTPATNKWTWMSGDSAVNKNGVYGTVGTYDSANKPGGRYDGAGWIEETGKLWLFGGISVGGTGNAGGSGFYLNDLWCYDPAINLWTWLSGDSTINKTGTAGNKGMVSPANKPGARAASISWKDKAGDFWLMGGVGYGIKGGSNFLNDVWKFSPAALALPVRFIYFTAAAQNNKVSLNWQIGNGQHSGYYIILRSHDSISYDSIGVVPATGNVNAVSTYSFADSHPVGNVNYYRIRYVDKDGKYTYSIIRKVTINIAGFSYTIKENPVINELLIYLQSSQSLQLQLEVRDAAGNLLVRQHQSISTGVTASVIPVRQLSAGAYFITIHAGKTMLTKKFMKR